MIRPKFIIKSLICKTKKHSLVSAGSCPFTGITYQYCERCAAIVPIKELV
jgi:hypothetical protein